MDTDGKDELLVGADATRAWAAIDDTAQALAALPREHFEQDPSLAGGSAGVALYFAYLAGAQEGRGHEDTAARLLEWAQDSVSSGQVPFGAGLYQGFTGVAWVAEHITGEPQDSIDEHMATYLARSPWREDYDLISGLSGFGVWALDALPREGAVRCLSLICERLVELAQPAAQGLTWWTRPELLPPHQLEQFPGGYENFGLAHGFPAVLSLLAQACASGALAPALAERAEATLRGGVARLLGVSRQGGMSRFPTMADAKTPPDDSRLAWCYGDPGVAISLAIAARLFDEPSWHAEAEATALQCARRPHTRAGIRDPGLCHGSAGLALLYWRLYQQYPHAELLAAARHWFTNTLDLRLPANEGFAGWTAWTLEGPRPASEWLTGANGICMALLAAVTGDLPEWDRILMASAAPVAIR